MIRFSLVLLGVLDLYMFYSTYWIFSQLVEKINIPIVLETILVLSLLVTGILLILNRKIGLIIFYFQFPFRIAFFILTFGFILDIFRIPFESILYKTTTVLLIILEFFRLAYSIFIHKNKAYVWKKIL